MATQTSYQYQLPPEYVQERQKDLLLTLFGSKGQEPTLPDGTPNPNYVQGLINTPRDIAKQTVAGFTQPQQDAFALAGQGIGAFQPYVTQAGQTAIGAGQTANLAGQTLAGAQQQFVPVSYTHLTLPTILLV